MDIDESKVREMGAWLHDKVIDYLYEDAVMFDARRYCVPGHDELDFEDPKVQDELNKVDDMLLAELASELGDKDETVMSLTRKIVCKRFDEGETDIRDLEDSLVDSFGDLIHVLCVEEGERRGLKWREE
jgi:hypothetical protein